MMNVPEGELCDECGTFMSWDFTMMNDATREAFAYYDCNNDACDNFGYFEFSY